MAFATGSLLLIVEGGPVAEANRLASKLVEGLAEEFRASPAKVNPSRFAALFSDWSHSKESHCFRSALKTLSIGAAKAVVRSLSSTAKAKG
jgi:hypothetical protein